MSTLGWVAFRYRPTKMYTPGVSDIDLCERTLELLNVNFEVIGGQSYPTFTTLVTENLQYVIRRSKIEARIKSESTL